MYNIGTYAVIEVATWQCTSNGTWALNPLNNSQGNYYYCYKKSLALDEIFDITPDEFPQNNTDIKVSY